MQDLNDMLLFAEVVDQGSFAAAGRTLGLPKSTLSRRVAELEGRLGVRLLHRTTRKLSLTEAGELYHRHCVAMREQAQAAEEAVAAFHDEPRGTVRVACPVTLAQINIGPLLPAFLARHPFVRIEMQVTNRVVDLVQEGFDVALRVRPTVDDSGSLVVKRLARTRALLVASPAQLEREGRPASTADLPRLSTVAMSAVDGRASLVLQGPQGERYELAHRPVFVADDLLTVKHAITEGLGMGILPDYICAREMRGGTLVEALPGWNPAPGVLHAVFPSRRGMVPAVRRFLDFLGEQVKEEDLGANCPG
ncbi:LysR family transcriptional regulator [Ramlibacter humi]|uniref:LysR family transcriptional regulator n=1 Tax=Ramlibacter humi TaxID=2530451 RepID=A0A4Z0CDM1_9BURK|nr:LysR family transcriptional regulator [Ramlibacter humi]TFZ08415.1 LysR family transcriptional regulator [Ramlibacter humi]